MRSVPRKPPIAVAALVLAGVVAPLLLYWIVFGAIPTVLPDGAKELLGKGTSATALVDVRDPD
jgi:hypothetical protein